MLEETLLGPPAREVPVPFSFNSSIVQYVRRGRHVRLRVFQRRFEISLRPCASRRRSSGNEIVTRLLQRKISTLRGPRKIEFIFELSCGGKDRVRRDTRLKM
jgi:hypothetical protein